MSPTYFLTLVLTVTLFLTTTSLIDVPNHQPSATFKFKNELRKPVPPQRGGGHSSIGQANKYDPKPQKEPNHPGNGHDTQLYVNKEAIDKKSLSKPGHPNNPHVNEEAVNKKPINKPGGPHNPHVNAELTNKAEARRLPINKPRDPHDPHANEEAVYKKPINKPGGPHNPSVNEKELVYRPKPKPGHTNVFVEEAKGKKGDDRDKRGGHHANVETAKEKHEPNKPRTGN